MRSSVAVAAIGAGGVTLIALCVRRRRAAAYEKGSALATCRICFDEAPLRDLVSPCECTGTIVRIPEFCRALRRRQPLSRVTASPQQHHLTVLPSQHSSPRRCSARTTHASHPRASHRRTSTRRASAAGRPSAGAGRSAVCVKRPASSGLCRTASGRCAPLPRAAATTTRSARGVSLSPPHVSRVFLGAHEITEFPPGSSNPPLLLLQTLNSLLLSNRLARKLIGKAHLASAVITSPAGYSLRASLELLTLIVHEGVAELARRLAGSGAAGAPPLLPPGAGGAAFWALWRRRFGRSWLREPTNWERAACLARARPNCPSHPPCINANTHITPSSLVAHHALISGKDSSLFFCLLSLTCVRSRLRTPPRPPQGPFKLSEKGALAGLLPATGNLQSSAVFAGRPAEAFVYLRRHAAR